MVERNGAINLRVQSKVAAHANVAAGVNLGSALADDDRAGVDYLPAIALHSEAFALAVASVAAATTCLFMRHGWNSLSLLVRDSLLLKWKPWNAGQWLFL